MRKPFKLRPIVNLTVAILNAVLLAGAFMFYTFYTEAYGDRLREENISNISNLNHGAAVNATALFDSQKTKLADICTYIEKHEMTLNEALITISETNTDEKRCFQLIGSDKKGFLAKQNADGSFDALDYSDSSRSDLHKVFAAADETIRFTPEFTDASSGLHYFAICRKIMIVNDYGASVPYTLMLATSSKNILGTLNGQVNYDGQSVVLIDEYGNYIVKSIDFKALNFFDYLYTYNDLTLDQKNAIRDEVTKNGSGELYYKNAGTVVEDCVFRYERFEESGWYCVTCVPLSSFHAPDFNRNYVVYAVVMLAVLFVVDMIWMQRMNRRLRISMLREKEASSAKGNFMSRMSHEIRTPLNAIIGYNTIAQSEMAAVKTDSERVKAESKVLDCLAKSEIASKHLLTIINDVLDMSAIESGKIIVAHDRFDFKALITSLTTIFYSQAQAKGVDFEVIFGTLTEEWFVGDQMRTNQILTNLLSNAVKFTSEGGFVKLKINQPEADTNASHIHFDIIDNGIGMTNEYLSHIWTPFEQADSSISRRFGGTGLGLAITKNLVDLMGGRITVESAPGKGTHFSVDLNFGRTEQPVDANGYSFSDINALVVDDDNATCDYIRTLFLRCGARCVVTTSGEDALTTFERAFSSGEPYNLCIIDWRMPRLDGVEIASRIRKTAGDTLPIIVLTAYDYTEIADAAAKAGINRFVPKPLFQSTLFDLLTNVMGQKPQKKTHKANGFDFTGCRVLLAEDNEMNMEIAKKIMESANLTVDSAWNGSEAVEIFTLSDENTYDAILMDVHMPEMNGHDATRAIRASAHKRAKTVPIIAMTADAFTENVAEAIASDMNDHISKPIDVQILFKTLAKYIG